MKRWLIGLIYLTFVAGFFDAYWGTTAARYDLFDYGFLAIAWTVLSFSWAMSLFIFLGNLKTASTG